jgi:Protein of unknown function (DUF2891)
MKRIGHHLCKRAPAAAILLTMIVIAAPGAQETPKPPAQDPPAAVPEFKDLDAFLSSLPAAKPVPPLGPEQALLLSTVPLACVDELQPKPAGRTYFWEVSYKTVDGYARNRAFYGCGDWHSAVNATWTLVTLLRRYPDLPIGGLIREKLTDHLGRQNFEGEAAFFKDAGNFERPYGYAWLLKLQAELGLWKDPEASRWTDNVAPLSKQFAESLVTYFVDLDRPNRSATQANSAFALGLLLDYVDVTKDTMIQRSTGDAARRFYSSDTTCATESEASSPELVSPCLAAAALMSRVLDRPAFVSWFDKVMPQPHAVKFRPLTTVSLEATGRRGGRGSRGAATAPAAPAPPDRPAGGERGATAEPPKTMEAEAAAAPAGQGRGRGGPPPNPRVTWASLAFTRAMAYSRIAAALPPEDKRIAVFRRLEAIHAEKGLQGLADPAAFDAPSLGTYAISYLTMTETAR